MTRISVMANTGRTLQLYIFDCPTCGVVFGVDNAYDNRRRTDGGDFHCPNGHTMSYGETKADKELRELRERNGQLHTRMLAERDQAWAARREAAEAKAEEIRLRWRVGNGVCPCCSRTFPGLAAHVATKHPEFLTRDIDSLSHRQVQLLASLKAATEAENTALIDVDLLVGDWRTVRALERRNLVTVVGAGRIALTEHGWPLAEQADATLGAGR